MADNPEIIIVKKKGGHGGGHHGGAWKVAYADFVTAMMSLFIVLWLMNSSKQVQEAVGGYFKDPRGLAKVVGTIKNGSGVYVALKKEDMKKLKEELLRSIHHLDPPDKLKNQIEITVTPEGLRIELMESAKGTQQDLHRRPHRFAGLFRPAHLRQLGPVLRSRQRRPPPDAGAGHPPQPDLPGPRLRRPAAARPRAS
jgi:hypothetical protein